ncbi:MAG: transposase [Campylobacterales bacterium]|nr:transposase [Campylobacterales bacterium]
MSRKKSQTYSAEQKTKIVLELLKEDQTIAELASKYKITSQSIMKWKKQFLENASLAFEPAKYYLLLHSPVPFYLNIT